MAIVSGRENNHSPTMGALANFAAQIRRLTLPSLQLFSSCIVSGLYLGIAVFVVEQGWA